MFYVKEDLFLYQICFEASTINFMSLRSHNSYSLYGLICYGLYLRFVYLIEPEIDEGVAGDVGHGEDVTHEEQDGGMARRGARVPLKG